tara:strand:+ start:368 stop:514 length:147 start_codon:yes stop_codon:yes gene_type:complete
MSSKLEEREVLKQEALNKAKNGDNLFGSLLEQSESEIKWVELHQMFDR